MNLILAGATGCPNSSKAFAECAAGQVHGTPLDSPGIGLSRPTSADFTWLSTGPTGIWRPVDRAVTEDGVRSSWWSLFWHAPPAQHERVARFTPSPPGEMAGWMPPAERIKVTIAAPDRPTADPLEGYAQRPQAAWAKTCHWAWFRDWKHWCQYRYFRRPAMPLGRVAGSTSAPSLPQCAGRPVGTTGLHAMLRGVAAKQCARSTLTQSVQASVPLDAWATSAQSRAYQARSPPMRLASTRAATSTSEAGAAADPASIAGGHRGPAAVRCRTWSANRHQRADFPATPSRLLLEAVLSDAQNRAGQHAAPTGWPWPQARSANRIAAQAAPISRRRHGGRAHRLVGQFRYWPRAKACDGDFHPLSLPARPQPSSAWKPGGLYKFAGHRPPRPCSTRPADAPHPEFFGAPPLVPVRAPGPGGNFPYWTAASGCRR